MVTVSQLVQDVRDILDEPAAAQWTDAMLVRWLNEANRDLARITHHYKNRSVTPALQDVSEYTMPSNILTIEHVYYDDGSFQRPLTPRHFEQMDQVWGNRQDWGGGWPEFYTTWGNSPSLIMRIFPVPQVMGDQLIVLSSVLPVEMNVSTPSQNVEVPSAWYDCLGDYCMYKAMLRDRDPNMDRALAAYSQKRDAMLANNDYLPVAREMMPAPMSRSGWVPDWLAQF